MESVVIESVGGEKVIKICGVKWNGYSVCWNMVGFMV